MIKSKKYKLLIVLVLIFSCIPALAIEPNEPKMPKAKLKFEISTGIQGYSGIGTIKPTHVARLFINYIPSLPHFSNPEEMKMIFETSAGQVLSQKQRDFLMSSKSSRYGGSDECPRGYHYFCALYAVSEDDAKKMAEVVIELLTEKASARMRECKRHLHETQEKIAGIKKNLPFSWHRLR